MKKTDLQVILQNAIAAHRAGNFTQAATLYEEALIHVPYRPEILFNLGLVLIASRQMEPAAYSFEQVLKIDPDHVPAHYYLANCYFSLEKFDLAQFHYEKVLNFDPSHVDALTNLGALLLHEKNPEHAMQCFSAVLAAHPEHYEARNNLAAALMALQRYYHAAEHFRYLLDRKPNDIGVRYSYGMCLLDSGDFLEAIKQFEKVLQLKSDHLDAETNLGITYLKSGDVEKAKKIFAAVLQHQPVNPEIDYLYRAITGETPPDLPPSAYVKNLFDHYAKHYEQHVVDTLHYTVPQQLHNLLEKHVAPLPDRRWKVLDLGCGTGLSGLEFRGLAEQLAGVDISPHMLRLAKDKLIYDELIEGDLISVLQQTAQHYDLLIAADTFNYLGNFSTLMKACEHALKNKSYLLFSVETSSSASTWVLQRNARYAHNKQYLITQAEQHGFKVLAIEESVLRQQEQQAVKGWLCLFIKE